MYPESFLFPGQAFFFLNCKIKVKFYLKYLSFNAAEHYYLRLDGIPHPVKHSFNFLAKA